MVVINLNLNLKLKENSFEKMDGIKMVQVDEKLDILN